MCLTAQEIQRHEVCFGRYEVATESVLGRRNPRLFLVVIEEMEIELRI